MGAINRRDGTGFLNRKSVRGDPLLAKDLQALKDELRRGRIAVQSPLEAIDTPAGTLIRLAPETLATAARSGANGIPAMVGLVPGSAVVTLYDFDGTTLALIDVDPPVYAFNMASSAVGNNKDIQLKQMYGYWFVDWENCP